MTLCPAQNSPKTPGTSLSRPIDFIGFFAGQNTPFVPRFVPRFVPLLSRLGQCGTKLLNLLKSKENKRDKKWDKMTPKLGQIQERPSTPPPFREGGLAMYRDKQRDKRSFRNDK